MCPILVQLHQSTSNISISNWIDSKCCKEQPSNWPKLAVAVSCCPSRRSLPCRKLETTWVIQGSKNMAINHYTSALASMKLPWVLRFLPQVQNNLGATLFPEELLIRSFHNLVGMSWHKPMSQQHQFQDKTSWGRSAPGKSRLSHAQASFPSDTANFRTSHTEYIKYRHAPAFCENVSSVDHQKSIYYFIYLSECKSKITCDIFGVCVAIPVGTTSFINLAGEHPAACLVVCCICVILRAGLPTDSIAKSNIKAVICFVSQLNLKQAKCSSSWRLHGENLQKNGSRIMPNHTQPHYATLLWKTKTRSFHQTPLWSFWSRRPPAAPRVHQKSNKLRLEPRVTWVMDLSQIQYAAINQPCWPPRKRNRNPHRIGRWGSHPHHLNRFLGRLSISALVNDLRMVQRRRMGCCLHLFALPVDVVVYVVVAWLVQLLLSLCLVLSSCCLLVVLAAAAAAATSFAIGHSHGITSSLGEWAKTPLPSSFTKLAVPGVGCVHRQETCWTLEQQITSEKKLKHISNILKYPQTGNQWCSSVKVGFLHSLLCPALFGTSVSWRYFFIDGDTTQQMTCVLLICVCCKYSIRIQYA